MRVATQDGDYELTCDWLIVCDGARSPVRHMLGLDSEGQVFRDRFLIADIRMTTDFPTERWFWFDPPFHRNQSVLLHRQADNVWRVDFQLGWDADPDEEKKPQNIEPRLRAMLGPEADFELEWASVYTFQCRRMQKFRHGRVLFAGDAAHLVSPFGARGANSGVQDADNLVWKLELVLRGQAPESLLDTYDSERVAAADENILNSTRSTDFITPKSSISRTFRDAVLALARRHAFARRLVNSGRLSVPKVLADSCLNTPDGDVFAGTMVPGSPAADAPARGPCGDWLLRHLGGGFSLLAFGDDISPDAARKLAEGTIACRVVQVGGAPRDDRIVIQDKDGLIAARYDAQPRNVLPDATRPARVRAVEIIRPDRGARCDRSRDRQRRKGRAMGALITDPNMAAPDDFYEDLLGLHRDLTDAQSALVNAKLILLLANHVGDRDVLRQAMAAAREDVAPDADRRNSHTPQGNRP